MEENSMKARRGDDRSRAEAVAQTPEIGEISNAALSRSGVAERQ